jgi:hypothetical protein
MHRDAFHAIMEEYIGDIKKYYDCFDRRFHSIVTLLLLKINFLRRDIGRGGVSDYFKKRFAKSRVIDWNATTHPLPLSPTHIPSPQRGVDYTRVRLESSKT